MLETLCTACQYGNHHHQSAIGRPPKGTLGGARCRCEGECVDGRYIPEQFKNFIEAFDKAIKK